LCCFAAYRNQTGTVQCSRKHRPAEDPKDREVCEFDLKTEFGSNCSQANDYGFLEGKPCILIKVNKVLSAAALQYRRVANWPLRWKTWKSQGISKQSGKMRNVRENWEKD